MKELPATLLLCPFNFETLATQIYVFASQERLEKLAVAAPTIVAVRHVPLHFLTRAVHPPPSVVAPALHISAR
jgi:iron(III) transport system permease protein